MIPIIRRTFARNVKRTVESKLTASTKLPVQMTDQEKSQLTEHLAELSKLKTIEECRALIE